MIPAYRHSVSSVIPLDLNEDQNHELFTPTHHAYPSFSSLSSSYPLLFNPPEQEAGSHYWEPTKHLPAYEQAEKINPTRGSWDHSVAVWKNKERSEDDEAAAEDGSVNLMSSKMRMMRKMMVPDQTGAYIEDSTMHKFEDQKEPLSPLGTDNSSSSNNYSNHSNNTVRVCADCHTTKTPLWRSGPRGPKSLCNACGIRQRKARRAMAAAASGNGTVILETQKSVKGNKLQKKEKKTRTQGAPQMKKKRNHGVGAKPSQSRNKFGFEDLTLRLRKSLAMHQVFPQDEKEAAILLMALSYGLVHG
ncbi:hypothetical protein ACSQ67_006533 [Phaseolus vulgaris]